MLFNFSTSRLFQNLIRRSMALCLLAARPFLASVRSVEDLRFDDEVLYYSSLLTEERDGEREGEREEERKREGEREGEREAGREGRRERERERR